MPTKSKSGKFPMVVMQAPKAPPPARRGTSALAKYKERAKEIAGRARAKAVAVAKEEKNTLIPIGGAAALGLFKRFLPDVYEKISIGPLGPEAVLGTMAFIGGRYTKSPMLKHLATGFLSVAAFRLATELGVSGVDTIPQDAPEVILPDGLDDGSAVASY